MSSTSGPTLVATASDRIVSSIHSALASLSPTPRNSNTPRQIGTPPLSTLSSLSHNKVIGVDSGRILPAGYGNGYGAGYTSSRKDGHEQQQSSSSASSSSISYNDSSASSTWPQGQDLEEDDLLDIHTRLQDRQQRNQIAKEAAKILLAQFMQDDDEYEVFPRLSPSLSRTTRLGLAPMTLLLNPVSIHFYFYHYCYLPLSAGRRETRTRDLMLCCHHQQETPCPTKIIPLPTSSSSSSNINNNNVASYASSSSSEDSNNNVGPSLLFPLPCYTGIFERSPHSLSPVMEPKGERGRWKRKGGSRSVPIFFANPSFAKERDTISASSLCTSR